MYRKNHRALTTFVSLFFIPSTLLAVVPITPIVMPSISSPELQVAEQFFIPASLGEIQEIIRAEDAQHTVFHIQDAHGQYEAQVSIQKLIDYLKKEYGSTTVLVEGGVGNLEPERFRLFENSATNNQFLDRLAKESRLSGAEWALIQDPELQGLGIENIQQYKNGIELFREVQSGVATREGLLQRIRQILMDQEGKYLQKKARTFLREWRDFQDELRSLKDYLHVLQKSADEVLGLDLLRAEQQLDYPNLTRFYRLSALPKGLNLEFAKSQSAAWSEELRQVGIEQALLKRLEKVESELSPRLLFEEIQSGLGEEIDFSAYPEFKQYAQYLIFQSEIQSEELHAEIETVTEHVFAKLAESEQEAQILQDAKDEQSMRLLLSLKLSSNQYQDFLTRKNAIEARFDFSEKEQELYKVAGDFYQSAKKREEYFAHALSENWKRNQDKPVVLVTGGFHAEGMQDWLVQHAVNYVSIHPNMTVDQFGYERYVDGMMEQKQSTIAGILQIMNLATQEALSADVLSRAEFVIGQLVDARESLGLSVADLLALITDERFPFSEFINLVRTGTQTEILVAGESVASLEQGALNIQVDVPEASLVSAQSLGAQEVEIDRDFLVRAALNFDWRYRSEAQDLLAKFDRGEALEAKDLVQYGDLRDGFTRAMSDRQNWFDVSETGQALKGTTVVSLSLEGFIPGLFNGMGGLGMLNGDWIQAAFERGAQTNLTPEGMAHEYVHMPTLLLYQRTHVNKLTPWGDQDNNHFRYNWEDWKDDQGYQRKVDNLKAKGLSPLIYPQGHDKAGQEVLLGIAIPGKQEPLNIRVWRVPVDKGFVTMLDTDIPENSPEYREYSREPYREPKAGFARFIQQWVLGVGAIEIFDELNLMPSKSLVMHANETGTVMAIPALMAFYLKRGLSYEDAVQKVRNSVQFTTHTLVPAGFDFFNPDLSNGGVGIEAFVEAYFRQKGIADAQQKAYWMVNGYWDGSRFINAGLRPNTHEWYTSSLWAIGWSLVRNAVSQLNAQVATVQLRNLLPQGAHEHLAEGAKGYEAITNGVADHWFPAWLRNLVDLDRRDLGQRPFYERVLNGQNNDHRWLYGQIQPEGESLEAVKGREESEITDEKLNQNQAEGARDLVDFIRDHVKEHDGESIDKLKEELNQSPDNEQIKRRIAFLEWRKTQSAEKNFFDANNPIFVWARRIVPYKRMLKIMLGHHLERIVLPKIEEIVAHNSRVSGGARPITVTQADEIINILQENEAFRDYVRLLRRGAQFVYAGKAYDAQGRSQLILLNRILQRSYEDNLGVSEGNRGFPDLIAKQSYFFSGYTELVAKKFAAGATAYIATSEVPLEASGTSPMKPMKPVFATHDGYEKTHIVDGLNGWMFGMPHLPSEHHDGLDDYFYREASDMYTKFALMLDAIEDQPKWNEMRRASIYATLTQLDISLSQEGREVVDLPGSRITGVRQSLKERGYFRTYLDVSERSRSVEVQRLLNRRSDFDVSLPDLYMSDEAVVFTATLELSSEGLYGQVLDPNALDVRLAVSRHKKIEKIVKGRVERVQAIKGREGMYSVQIRAYLPLGLLQPLLAEKDHDIFNARFFVTHQEIPERLKQEFATWQGAKDLQVVFPVKRKLAENDHAFRTKELIARQVHFEGFTPAVHVNDDHVRLRTKLKLRPDELYGQPYGVDQLSFYIWLGVEEKSWQPAKGKVLSVSPLKGSDGLFSVTVETHIPFRDLAPWFMGEDALGFQATSFVVDWLVPNYLWADTSLWQSKLPGNNAHFTIEASQTKTEVAESLGQVQNEQVRLAFLAEGRNPEAALAIVLNLTEGIIQLQAERSVLEWILNELGYLQTRANFITELGMDFEAGAMDALILRDLGMTDQSPRGTIPVIVNEKVMDFALELTQEKAESLLSVFQPGDLLAILYDGDQPEWVNQLYAGASQLDLDVRAVPQSLADAKLPFMVRKQAEVPLMIADQQDDLLEIHLQGEKVLLDLEALAEAGIKPLKVLSLLKQIGSDPSLFLKMHLYQDAFGFWLVDKSFVSYLADLHSQLLAERQTAIAA